MFRTPYRFRRITMKQRATRFPRWLHGVLLAGVFAASFAHADNSPIVFVGKNEWLFSRLDFPDTANESATNASMDLIRRFNKVMARNDITMVFTMPPLRSRLYAKYLPDDVKVSP